jgi:hypothetical protein
LSRESAHVFDLFPVPLNTQTLISHHFHNTLSHTLSHTLFHTHSFTHTLSHTLFHTHSFTHTLSHTLLSLSHTFTHTHTHTLSPLLPGLLHDGWLLSAIQILSASGDEHYSDAEVREMCLYYTCWLYSLCNFQYRQQYENTCSDHFDC